MIEIKNCVFDAQDTAETLKKCSMHGLVLKGDEEVVVENCVFNNRGYSAININGSCDVTVKNCEFNCDTIYNPIEGTKVGSSVVIENNVFNGKCGNNYVNFYSYADNAVINMADNKFPGVDPSASEVIRISNANNANVTINVNGDAFDYTSDYVGDYTSYIMCQDYTAKNGKPQDFSKVVVNLKDVKCNGEVISADHMAQGQITFTYQDGAGIIADNNPVINF